MPHSIIKQPVYPMLSYGLSITRLCRFLLAKFIFFPIYYEAVYHKDFNQLQCRPIHQLLLEYLVKGYCLNHLLAYPFYQNF